VNTRLTDDNPFAAPESDISPVGDEPGDPSLPAATMWQRSAALVVDAVVLTMLVIVMEFVTATLFGFPPAIVERGPTSYRVRMTLGQIVDGIPSLFNLAIVILYFAVQEASAAQATLGKRMYGIHVTDLERRRVSFGRALARAVCRLPGIATFPFDRLIRPSTAGKPTLHDLLTGTLVIGRNRE